LCAGKTFTSTQFCDKNSLNTADSVYTKCGNTKQYDPTEQFCYNGSGSVLPKCEGGSFDPTKKFCVEDHLYNKCNGKEYQVDIYTCNISSDGTESIGNIFTDERDNNREYPVVFLGSQTWMAENMHIDKVKIKAGSVIDIGKCYDDDDDNCDTYGRLYTWTEAMALSPDCITIPNDSKCRAYVPWQGICPDGWHIPSDKEWADLVDYAGGGAGAGKVLKAETGWNGWNITQFSALPGGWSSDGTTFADEGDNGFWWTASVSRDDDKAISYFMTYVNNSVNSQDDSKGNLYSVRCVYGDGGK